MELIETNKYISKAQVDGKVYNIKDKEARSSIDTINQAVFEKPNIIDGHEFVDLGMMTADGKHLLWATKNVGASSPEDGGLLFQWGRTDGYAYGDTNHQFRTAEQNTADTGNQYIPKTTSGENYSVGSTLSLADDAANANMGGSWRMPTKSEFDALDSLDSTYTTYNGVNGRKFTGNGNSLFIPVAGFFNNSFTSGGYVWSSSLHSYIPAFSNAIAIDFRTPYCEGHPRSLACSVRGVIEATDEDLKRLVPSFYTKSETDTKLNTKQDSLTFTSTPSDTNRVVTEEWITENGIGGGTDCGITINTSDNTMTYSGKVYELKERVTLVSTEYDAPVISSFNYPNIPYEGGSSSPSYSYKQRATKKYSDNSTDVSYITSGAEISFSGTNVSSDGKVEYGSSNNVRETKTVTQSTITVTLNGKTSTKTVTVIQDAMPHDYYVGEVDMLSSEFAVLSSDVLLTSASNKKCGSNNTGEKTVSAKHKIFYLMIPTYSSVTQFEYLSDGNKSDILAQNAFNVTHSNITVNGEEFKVLAYRQATTTSSNPLTYKYNVKFA